MGYDGWMDGTNGVMDEYMGNQIDKNKQMK